MRPLSVSAILLVSAFGAFSQDPSEWVDKAPPAVDEALRARVDKFYAAFVAGKFKEAYSLVADDSQDKFFELGKDQYKGCEIVKTRYAENFTKASVLTNCKGDWRWGGTVNVVTFPLNSNWELVDGEWYWHYVRPTRKASPFSPTGFVAVPSDDKSPDPPIVPQDIAGAAKTILARVSVDKHVVQLRSYETSQDVVHVRNDMPGSIGLKLDALDVPGLKISMGKTVLQANEETNIVFDWRLDDPAVLCADCAKKTTGNPTLQLHIVPTGQVFPISIKFANHPGQSSDSAPVPTPSSASTPAPTPPSASKPAK